MEVNFKVVEKFKDTVGKRDLRKMIQIRIHFCSSQPSLFFGNPFPFKLEWKNNCINISIVFNFHFWAENETEKKCECGRGQWRQRHERARFNRPDSSYTPCTGPTAFSCADKITTPATHLSLQFLHFAGSLVSGQILFILNNNIIILDRYKRTDFSSSSASSIRGRRWKMGLFHLPTDMNECLGEMNSSQSAQQALLGVEVAHWSIGTGTHEFRSRNATRPVSKQLRKNQSYKNIT